MASPPHPYKLTTVEYLNQWANRPRHAKKVAEKYRLGAMQTRVMKAYHNAAKSATKKSQRVGKSLLIYPKSMIKSMLKKTQHKKGGKSRRGSRRTRRTRRGTRRQ